jgi:hypothetical protein
MCVCVCVCVCVCKDVLQLRRLVAGFPLLWPGFEPRSGHVGFVVDREALAKVLSQNFDISCQAIDRLLHAYPLPGPGTEGQTVTNIRSGPTLIPPQRTN